MKDPDAMDIDRVMVNKLSTQDKECYFREGRCFKCGSRGHRAAKCHSKGNPTQEGHQEKERRTFKNSANKNVRTTETATITEVKEDPPAPLPKEATKEQPMTVDTRVAKIKVLFVITWPFSLLSFPSFLSLLLHFLFYLSFR